MNPKLVIKADLVEAMKAHARQCYPVEACGVLTGPVGTDRPDGIVHMRNVLESSTGFEFDPEQQLQAWRYMEANGEEPVVIYHSHTSPPIGIPSSQDIGMAMEPKLHYVIVTVQPGLACSVHSYRISNGQALEEEIVQVNAYKIAGGGHQTLSA